MCLTVFLSACGSDSNSVSFGTEDQEKLIGTWNGKYGCGDPNFDDQIIIGKNTISIPEQQMGGFPGTANINYLEEGSLSFSQTGVGITCNGIAYVKTNQTN